MVTWVASMPRPIHRSCGARPRVPTTPTALEGPSRGPVQERPPSDDQPNHHPPDAPSRRATRAFPPAPRRARTGRDLSNRLRPQWRITDRPPPEPRPRIRIPGSTGVQCGTDAADCAELRRLAARHHPTQASRNGPREASVHHHLRPAHPNPRGRPRSGPPTVPTVRGDVPSGCRPWRLRVHGVRSEPPDGPDPPGHLFTDHQPHGGTQPCH